MSERDSNILLNLPREVFAYLLSFLDLDHMTNLERSSREMRMRFVSENIWENHARSLYHKGKFGKHGWMRGVLFKSDAKVKIPGRSPHSPRITRVLHMILQKKDDDCDESGFIFVFWSLQVAKSRAQITNFELYAHEETRDGVPEEIELWDKCFKVGYRRQPSSSSSQPVFSVRLNKDKDNFKTGQKYHFSLGPFPEGSSQSQRNRTRQYYDYIS